MCGCVAWSNWKSCSKDAFTAVKLGFECLGGNCLIEYISS